MADVELVIKIPEEIMDYIKRNECLSVIYTDEVADAIIKGTQLPKGHGRLKDVDCGLKKCKDEHEIEYWDKEVPTIIEADKENEEPKQTLKRCKNCGYPHKLAGKCYSCNDYSQWIPIIEADKGGIKKMFKFVLIIILVLLSMFNLVYSIYNIILTIRDKKDEEEDQ